MQRNPRGQRHLDRPAEDPHHFSCSKRSRNIFSDQVEQVQDERHVKIGAKRWDGTGEERRQAQGCVGGFPRFGLGIYLRTLRYVLVSIVVFRWSTIHS